MTLGNQLQKIRQRKGMTQELVAHQLFITRQTVSRWENDSVLPPLAALTDLSTLYDVPLSELLGENKTHMNKKINPFALLGSVVFNFFTFLTLGLTLLTVWLSSWLIAAAFILSPVMLLTVVLLGIQHLAILQTLLCILFFAIGLSIVKPLKNISNLLYGFARNYIRYNINNVFYTTEITQG
ncbi:helix-turn-helix domain-containing protein [Fructobacillus parabroussonetiae]|uniref:Helix-turn-helix domain-containing protein n=1 Tax=Fructobacillus parabroussonetiae TaxID=2713174 RepID=A0ABS5QYW3_9LACO|nr:helix-turn-helix domain-containing protein [Fructobacillus parabroussonetiae]MBS9337092.1 helix-turn-helix domain-containing protein [Fructobacillus parabroussonetiae]MCK8617886.1 helix-turn-helix domain-containing protein [Fructobacillus parabroussonetiae]